MTKRPFTAVAVTATALATLLALSACVPNTPTSSGSGAADAAANALTVDSSSDACTVSAATAPSGSISFAVTNSSDQVTEFYLLADDGLRIVGEVENVSPGIERNLVVLAKPGTYYTVCKPGMVGDGIGKAEFTVTDSGEEVAAGDDAAAIEAAATNYVAYAKNQVEGLVTATKTFTEAYLAGDDETARSLYPTTRAAYERIEPLAESFGDLDPKIDFREADVPEDTEWTGWHRIEKDLFPPTAEENGGDEYVALTDDERTHFADLLNTDTEALNTAVHEPDYTVTIDAISNGAIGLLDEVASGKITGEEEIWSHTDLWDFQANLEGARVAYEGVRDIAEPKDAELVATLDEEFTALETLLAQYGSLEDGFVYYDELTADQIKELANGVNALAEPLSELTAVVVG
jgi:iron uptake system component EfeO